MSGGKIVWLSDQTEAAIAAATRGEHRAPVIVSGPAGSGKTRNAEALARHYKCRFILDGWTRGKPKGNGCLVLTSDSHPGAIPIAAALRAAGLGKEGAP